MTIESQADFIHRVRNDAVEVAREGYWPAPKGLFLYWAVNRINWKIYIGITNDFGGRISDHKNAALNGSALPIHAAIRKYGADAFEFVPIEQFDTELDLMAAERQAIEEYQSQDRRIGYNIADGGLGLGSRGAKEVHARPDFRAKFLASYPARAIKAAETRRRNREAASNTAGQAIQPALF